MKQLVWVIELAMEWIALIWSLVCLRRAYENMYKPRSRSALYFVRLRGRVTTGRVREGVDGLGG